jgi:hypothetical protein
MEVVRFSRTSALGTDADDSITCGMNKGKTLMGRLRLCLKLKAEIVCNVHKFVISLQTTEESLKELSSQHTAVHNA